MAEDAFAVYDSAENNLASLEDEVRSVAENFRNIACVLESDIERLLRPDPNVIGGSEMVEQMQIADQVAIDPSGLMSYNQIVALADKFRKAKDARDAAWNLLL